MKRALVLLVLVGCAPTPHTFDCTALKSDNASFPEDRDLGALLDHAAAAGLPGVAMIIDDPVLGTWVGTRGYSDLASKTPVSSCHLFKVGSITKTFTATAILQLVDRGKLTLDQPLRELVGPEAIQGIDHADQVTVRQLLNHTSGLFNYIDAPEFFLTVLNNPGKVLTAQDFLSFVRGRPAPFPAGARFSYSNTNYELLGLVVEKVSGMKLGAYIDQHISKPLGLAETTMASAVTPEPAGQTTGYHNLHNDGALVDFSGIKPFQLSASGGVVSSMRDLSTFLDGLLRGGLVSPASLEQMEQWVDIPADGFGFKNVAPLEGYGLGLLHSHLGLIGNSGSNLGVNSHLYRFASGRTLVAFTNASGIAGDAFDDVLRTGIASGVLH